MPSLGRRSPFPRVPYCITGNFALPRWRPAESEGGVVDGITSGTTLSVPASHVLKAMKVTHYLHQTPRPLIDRRHLKDSVQLRCPLTSGPEADAAGKRPRLITKRGRLWAFSGACVSLSVFAQSEV